MAGFFLHNADRFFPTTSSIKIAVIVELYRQDQEMRSGAKGKARLDDTYTFDPKDLVEDSRIMPGPTTGVTHVTNRDLAQFMITVSDNAAANILIDRVGKDNVNATLRGLGLSKTMLRRKMIDITAARRGDENVATPEEMVRLLEAIYKAKVLQKEATAALKQLSTLKQSHIPRLLPGKGSGGEQARRIGGRANGFRHRSRAKSPVCDQRNDCLRPRRTGRRARH
jgi:beta-lactamase class A